jgi:hypothetical protein
MFRVSAVSFSTTLVLLLAGCGSSRTSAPAPAGDDVGTIQPTPGQDSGVTADAGDATATSETSAEAAAPDFGPTEDVVTVGDGPAVDPGTPGPIDGCTVDVARLSAAKLAPVAAAFATAWKSEAAKLSAPPLVFELRGLLGSSAALKLKVGRPEGSGFAADPTPVEIAAPLNRSTRLLSAPRADVSFGVVFGETSVPVAAIAVKGTLGASCASLGGATVTLLIPASAASIPFGGSTIGALLGPTNDAVGADDAWRVQLTADLGGS